MGTITGTPGNDTIFGSGAGDTMVGLAGDDTYVVVNSNDIVIEQNDEGNDLVYTTVSWTITDSSYIETLSAQDWSSTTALTLIGNSFNNRIFGNAGANFLNGGGGADELTGFGGDDIYVVDNAGDKINEAIGAGFDYVYALVDYTLSSGASVEALSAIDWSFTTPLNLTGNELDNPIYGNAGANVLNGAGGADEMTGFGGDDVYVVDNAGDKINEALGAGSDAVYALVDYTLSSGASVEMLSAIDWTQTTPLNLTGNELDNPIYGNAGANLLNGAGGADTLTGFGGDDLYVVDNIGDAIIEAAGQGNDTVYALVSYVLSAGASVETLTSIDQTGTGALNLTGNELANSIFANAGINVIDGKGGNDVLKGFGGADTFAFTTALGAGNVDIIIDFAAGTDKISLGGAAGQPFLALATGTLRAGTLVIGSAALDADDYLLYNSGTGALLYDADGNGAGAAVQFATLSTGLGLTVADFIVSGTANTAPAITSGATASIAENSSASTIVYQTAANDADGDRITYSLSGADAGLLTIDANGAVRLITPADFETKNSYSFNVVASDSGVATAKAVTLTITDVTEASTPIINETAASNDTRGTAQVIDPGTFVIANNPNLPNDDYPSATIVGSISSLTDEDYYAITLQAGQQLILDVDGTTTLDSFLTLYGPSGAFIGDNDDLITPDPGSGSQFGHNTDSQIIFRAATSGTYYFSIKSFVDDTSGPTSQGNYQINVSINSTQATPEQILAEDVDALISGASWNHTNLTYGFPNSAAQYPQDFDEVTPATKFEAFNATQMTATRSLLQLIANVTQLTFTENTTQGPYTQAGTAAAADLRYAESSEADVAYAYYPTNNGAGSLGGSAWFNHTNFNNPIRGNYAWMGILHETGHTLGLKHGHEFPLAVSADHDSLEYTVMTYRSYPGDSGAAYSNETYGYPQTLMMLDIAALQKIYNGANYAFNNTNSVYTWSETTGEMSINGTGQGAPGNGVGGTANRVFMTIWDGGGTDTYDLSNYNNGSTIDLRPGEWTTTSTDQLANLGDGHTARGNVANSLLFQGNTASAIENGKGGAGADTLIANLVANQLTGNGGNDTFKWMTTGDAGTGSLADTVLDFVRGADKIDFTALDANPATGAHDAFTFIGTGAFTNVAGQVRYDVTGGSAHIFADTDGNGTANMEIILTNITTLAGTDFNF